MPQGVELEPGVYEAVVIATAHREFCEMAPREACCRNPEIPAAT